MFNFQTINYGTKKLDKKEKKNQRKSIQVSMIDM